MVAEAEPLDRQRPHPEVALGLEQLWSREDVYALAVRKIEPQRIEARACDRHAEAGTVVRVLEREEDRLPARVPSQLRHLALDPDRRETAEPVRDAAVERRDGVDLAVAVLDRFDLHPGIVRPARAPTLCRITGGSRLPSRGRSP